MTDKSGKAIIDFEITAIDHWGRWSKPADWVRNQEFVMAIHDGANRDVSRCVMVPMDMHQTDRFKVIVTDVGEPRELATAK
jgi:hypothetical protein